MSPVQVRAVEETCTTTVRKAFVLQEERLKAISCKKSKSPVKPKSKSKVVSKAPTSISIDLPFPGDLGWSFALSLEDLSPGGSHCPVAFSFRRGGGGAISWGRTSIHAQLSLQADPRLDLQPGGFEDEEVQVNSLPVASIDTVEEPLCTIDAVLANTTSVDVPITMPPGRSIFSPGKVYLTVTISNHTFPDGLFQARSDPINEPSNRPHLQDHDRILSQTLATGRSFDVKFLTHSTRSTSRDPLPTYASLSVVKRHIDLSSSVLREGWTSALGALDNVSTKCARDISCPGEYDYELDSDFGDEDEIPPRNSSTDHDLAAREVSNTERSGSSFSSFSLERTSEVDCQIEEIINVGHLEELSSDFDCEKTIEIKFAAHRTWHAFLWYCYTGDLEFSKLRSQVEPGSRHLHVAPLEGRPPPCSPKSMYRLADLVGDKVLKAKALAAIKERTTAENVLDETFSVFTSKYPEVRQVQLGVLRDNRWSPEVKQAFPGAMIKYSSMSHAKSILSAVYENLVASETNVL